MPLDIPLVPVNYEAKTFAANALVQAINNLHLAQNSQPGGGQASTQKKEKEKKDDEDAKERARKDAVSNQTNKRRILEPTDWSQGPEPIESPPPPPAITSPAPATAPSQSPLGGGDFGGGDFGGSDEDDIFGWGF